MLHLNACPSATLYNITALVPCGRAGTLFGLSQHATVCIEDVAAAAPDAHRWYQSYLLKDRAATLDLVRRAVAAWALRCSQLFLRGRSAQPSGAPPIHTMAVLGSGGRGALTKMGHERCQDDSIDRDQH